MDMLMILDFGGSQAQSVAKRIRGEHVYCEVLPCDAPTADITAKNPKGILLIGGTMDAAAEGAYDCAQEVYDLGLPMLGLGYGARVMVKHFGGRLMGAVVENKPTHVKFDDCALFAGVSEADRYIDRADAWELPEGFAGTAGDGCGLDMAFACADKNMYGLQFYPEQNDPDGLRILSNFADICGAKREWSVETFIENQLNEIRAQVGEGDALIAISGGVDSTVCAALMHRAIGSHMHCVHVNTGLMRKNESAMIEKVFAEQGIDLKVVDAEARFLAKLAGVSDPEKKRHIIGEEFIRVFEEEAAKFGKVDFLVQGTIYPDVLESRGVGGVLVKSHHNVGGMPETMKFSGLVEPLKELFKDEVRQVGEALGLPAELVYRQPFPGPGLAVRCIGALTKERLDILREADFIFREEIANAGLDRKIWQYFAILTDMRSVGVRNGKRSYDYTVALRAINSIDAMSATVVRLPYDLLETVVKRITSEVNGVNRVVYDITGKPPATIEWE